MTKYLIINEIEYPVYADLQDAEIYNNAIYGSSWNTLDPTVQSQLLVEATRVIDSYKYVGEKVDPEQPLKFPRISSSGKVSDDKVLTDLCCQLANYIYKNGSSSGGGEGLLANLKKYQIGDMHVDFKDEVSFDLSGLDDYVLKALEDWMISSSMQIWL